MQTVYEKWFIYNEQIKQQIERELDNAEAIVWEQKEKEQEEAGEWHEEESREKKIEVKTVEIEVTAYE